MTPSQRIVRNTASAEPYQAGPNVADTETSGKGMLARLPQEDRTRTGSPHTQHDASVEASLALPHERDQSTDMTASKRDPVVQQAQRDVSRGIKDTSKGAEMDSAYKKLRHEKSD